MEIHLPTKQLTYFETVFQTTFTQEESYEAVVSDVLPDIREVLDTTGYVVVRSKDMFAGGMTVTGQVTAAVLYAPDGEVGVKCFRISIPLRVELENSAVTEEVQSLVEIRLLHLETQVLNPRKIAVKAELMVNCSCCRSTELVLPVAAEPVQKLHLLPGEVALDPLCFLREKTFVVSDEYVIPGTSGEGTEILRQQVQASVESVKCTGGKMLVKGMISNEMLFLAQGELQPAQAVYRTPFTQILDLEGEMEETGSGQAKLLLTGAFFEQTTGTKGELTVMAEFHLAAQVTYAQKTFVPYVADAYSNSYAMEATRGEGSGQRCEPPFVVRESYRETLEIPGEAKHIISVRANVGRCGLSDGKAHAGVEVCVLYCDSQGLVRSGEQRYHFSYPLPEAGAGLRLLEVQVTDAAASPVTGGLELRFGLEFMLQNTEPVTWNYIQAVSWDEAEQLDDSRFPSVLLRDISPAQSLWELAKSHHSTVAAIRAANDLEEEVQTLEGLAMIPKCR